MLRIRKVIILISLLSLFAIASPQVISAACGSPVCIFGVCRCFITGHFVTCYDNSSPPALIQCCDTTAECPAGTNPPGAPYLGGWSCTTASGRTGADTALGCLETSDVNLFVGQILRWGVGIAAAGAFFMLVYGGVQMMTASGDPKRVKAGQELIISSIAGVILIILSVILLNFLGINILGLGGLGF
jgi:hypothetical protein